MKRFLTLLALSTLGLGFVVLAGAQAASFTFTAAGDHGTGTKTRQSIDTVANSGSDFYLALGDLSYTAGGEQSWCTTFKAKFDDVEVLAGNHDTGESPGGDIAKYRQHCPFTLGSLTGNYGKQYYFDYPQADPLARFIMIAPGVKGSFNIDYRPAGSGYSFTRDAIDAARNRGIRWIIVGMHKNCISVGAKSCEVGVDIMRLLLDKKVDLILQSHDHNYQRSHQLSCLKTGTVQQSCIADNGSDGRYVKGKGSVILINGEFGVGLYNVSASDPEAGYFAKSDSTTWGVTRYTVSQNELRAQYLRSSGGGFADSFSITTEAAPPTPPPLTPSPGQQTYAADTFSRNVNDGWGQAEQGGTYSYSSTVASFDTNGTAGTISLDANATRAALLAGVAALNVDYSVRVAVDKTAAGGNQTVYLLARRIDNANEYRGRLRFRTDGQLMLIVEKVAGGSKSTVGSETAVPGVTQAAGTFYRVRMQVQGTTPTTIRLKSWADGQPEPSGWTYTGSDASPSLQTAGSVGMQAYLAASATNAPVLFSFDDLRVVTPGN